MHAGAVANSLMPSRLLLGVLWAAGRPLLGSIGRSPLSVTTLALIAAGYFLAAVNALYMQADPGHPPSYPSPESQLAIERELASIPLAEPALLPQVDLRPTQSVTLPAARVEIPGTVVGNPDTFRVQTMLKALGFFAETVDGYYGPVTAAAIRAFEARAGLTPSGAISPQVVGAMEESYARGAVRQGLSSAPAIPPEPIPEPVQRTASADPLARIAMSVAPEAPMAAASGPEHDLILAVQRVLASLGFLHGTIDGVAGEATARAIRNFEVFHNYPVTGDVSPELLDMLQAANATF
ncbi:MAG: peptidoglycan-binding domain-containing protein [Cucumibacter sp.]